MTDSTYNNPTSTSLLFFSPTHFVSVLGCFSYFLLNTCLFLLSLSLSLSLCNGFSFPFLCLCYFSSLSHSCFLDQLWRYKPDPLTLFSLDFQFFIFCSIWFLFVCWETPGKKRKKEKEKEKEKKTLLKILTFLSWKWKGNELFNYVLFFSIFLLWKGISWASNFLHSLIFINSNFLNGLVFRKCFTCFEKKVVWPHQCVAELGPYSG